MSEIGEEEIARLRVAIHGVLMDELYIETRSSGPRISGDGICDATQEILALLHPALERARVEEREKAALVVRVMGKRIFDELVARGVDPDLIADAFEKLADESDAEVAAIRKG